MEMNSVQKRLPFAYRVIWVRNNEISNMNSPNLLIKAMKKFFNKPPEEVFPHTDSSINKSLDFALSLSQYLAALDVVDRTEVINLMEFILTNPLPAPQKKTMIMQTIQKHNTTKKKPLALSLNPKTKKGKKAKPRKPKKKTAKVAGYLNYENIEGTEHNIVFRLEQDHIMEVRKNRFPYKRDPKIKVKENKAFECRETHSSYCGKTRAGLRNWLYFV